MPHHTSQAPREPDRGPASAGLVAAGVSAAPLLGRGRRSRSRPHLPAGNYSAGPAVPKARPSPSPGTWSRRSATASSG
jgi:hypothetical protein